MKEEIWKRTKEARVCKELNIQFRQDCSKEARETWAKLYLMVEERNGKRAFLKVGYAIIDGKKVEPPTTGSVMCQSELRMSIALIM